jgi:hypothetical protein
MYVGEDHHFIEVQDGELPEYVGCGVVAANRMVNGTGNDNES